MAEIVFSSDLKTIHDQIVVIVDEGIEMSWTVHEFFTSRACDELAAKLVLQIPDSELIHLRVGGELPFGYLVHAGVHRDDLVYDIEGVHEIDDWIERWSRGGDIEVLHLEPGSQANTFATAMTEALANETALAVMDVPEFAKARFSLALL